MSIDVPVDKGMVAGDRDVINNTNIAVLTSANLNFLLTPSIVICHKFFSINDMEHFLLVVGQAFEYDEILLRFFYTDYVNDLILESNLEG